MNLNSTFFLKSMIVLFGTAVSILCIFILCSLVTEDVGEYQPVLIGMLVASLPFFIGLNQTYKLLNLIDQKRAFTNLSVKALNEIKYCGIAIGTLYGIGLPYIFKVADKDDAPGVVLLGIIFTIAPLSIAVFAAIFQKLLKNAIKLKSENDLTV